jgi:adenine-specific DNA glycosylase
LGRENEIPRVTKRGVSPLHRRAVFVIERRTRGRIEWLIEQRPPTGRWAGMWQFPTCEAGDVVEPIAAARSIGLKLFDCAPIGAVSHALTHRKYEFAVYRATLVGRSIGTRRWVDRAALDTHPLSRPQLQAARLAGVFGAA